MKPSLTIMFPYHSTVVETYGISVKAGQKCNNEMILQLFYNYTCTGLSAKEVYLLLYSIALRTLLLSLFKSLDRR